MVAECGPKLEKETEGFLPEGSGCDPLLRVVLPVQAGPSALLGGLLPYCTMWRWCAVAEDGPMPETETGRPP